MNISVIGAGRVGLVVASCLAEKGNKVVCVDRDSGRIDALKRSRIPFFEPSLEGLVRRNSAEGRLFFTVDISMAVRSSRIIFLAAGAQSPIAGNSAKADANCLKDIFRSIAVSMDSYRLIVEKSTVPVRTSLFIKEQIERHKKKNIPFDVASNPEFLSEGTAVRDFMRPQRIVIGTQSKKARGILKTLYKDFHAPLIFTDAATAELLKYASNCFLATKISYINMLARLCETCGADIEDLAQGMGMDRRIGGLFLKPGIGFGGSCLPKDLDAFIDFCRTQGHDFRLLNEARKINGSQKRFFLEKLERSVGRLKGKTLAVWGLVFKGGTDDIRKSPALDIIKELMSKGVFIRAYDPAGRINDLKDLYFCKDKYETLEGSFCLLVLSDWPEFRKADIRRIGRTLKKPLIIDGRNIFDPRILKKEGIDYIGVGRGGL